VSTAPLLEAVDLHKRFGGIQALRGVSLSVQRGSIAGLVGPNGSGKTTVFNAVTGFARPDRGTSRFDGAEITHTPPHRIAGRGLARTFQNPADFPDLSVMENLLAAARNQPGDSIVAVLFSPRRVRHAERAALARAWEVLERLGLAHAANARAGDLTVGENRLLQVGRQLMAEPSMLLLDEPTSGLNPELQARLAELIRGLRDDRGMTFLIIEHNLGFIRFLSDTLYVMHLGEVISAGAPDEVSRDPRVIETYLGTGVDGRAA
jgi:ABC-type branched-subunit amino acid transport system ATPase component